jgi:hypothetical protein
MLGPPDQIDAHPSGGASQRPGSEGGAETIAYPFEEWHYLKVDGIGENVILTFVDSILNCEYGLILEPARKAALLQVPPRRPDDGGAGMERSTFRSFLPGDDGTDNPAGPLHQTFFASAHEIRTPVRRYSWHHSAPSRPLTL